MARTRLHTDDRILDAARDLWLADRAVTTGGISERSGAPVGSLYHRFGSRDALLASLWLRTVRRFQEGLTTAAAGAEPGLPRALAAAAWTVDYARTTPDDARLLLLHRRRDLPPEVPAAELNAPVAALVDLLTTELYGRRTAAARERVIVAVIDVPYGVVRRHLEAGTLRPRHRTLVTEAARALLGA